MSDERMLWGPFDLRFEPREMTDGQMSELEIVVDVEMLARGAMNVERWPIFLEAADNDELLGFLLGESVILERHYAPRRGIEARPWLFQRLRWKARDWRDAQARHRTLPELGRPDEWDDPDFGTASVSTQGIAGQSGLGFGQHGEPSGPPPGDRGDTGPDALRRLLESGDGPLLREIAALGLGPPPGTRGRSPRARRQLEALDRKRRVRVAAADRETVAA